MRLLYDIFFFVFLALCYKSFNHASVSTVYHLFVDISTRRIFNTYLETKSLHQDEAEP